MKGFATDVFFPLLLCHFRQSQSLLSEAIPYTSNIVSAIKLPLLASFNPILTASCIYKQRQAHKNRKRLDPSLI